MSDPNSRTRTLIVEKNTTGHRLYYVRLLAEAAFLRGDSVQIALCASSRTDPEIKVHLEFIDRGIEIIYVSSLGVSEVEGLSREVNADLTVVPDGDLFAIYLGQRGRWRGRGRLSILIMREFAQPKRLPGLQALKSQLRSFFFRRANRIPLVDITYLKPISWPRIDSQLVAFDPVTLTSNRSDSGALRSLWEIDETLHWFGILGAISNRKNCLIVAQAMLKMPPNRTGLLVAGKCDDDTLEQSADVFAKLRNLGTKVVVIDRLLSELEIDTAVRLLNCVVLAHSNEGSSGIFGKALASGTRVVAAGAVSLRRDCDAYPHAANWAPLSVDSIRNELLRALELMPPLPNEDFNSRQFVEALLK